MSCSSSNRPEIARCTQSVGVPLSTKYLRSPNGSTRSGTSSVSELLAPLRLRSGATTVICGQLRQRVAQRGQPFGAIAVVVADENLHCGKLYASKGGCAVLMPAMLREHSE